MDCLQAARNIQLFRERDPSITADVVQTSVDHVMNCRCGTCEEVLELFDGPQPKLSIAQA